MLNRNLSLLVIAFTIASCASHKKSSEAGSSKSPSKVVIEKSQEIEVDTMFSVSAEEIKKSESGAHVVYFSTNSNSLDDAAIAILKDKVLAEAKSANTKKVVIEAHCDERGSKAYNQKLSEKRAKAVKDYLVKNGVQDVKIKTVGYGESKPVALGHDEESWAKNRRAITISLKK
jgi:peptidoglycan-associated lipoprotein